MTAAFSILRFAWRWKEFAFAAAAAVAMVWQFELAGDARSRAELLKERLAAKNAEVRALEARAAARARLDAAEDFALEIERDRVEKQTDTYDRAREALAGAEDGAVAPVLRGAIDSVPE